MKRLVSFWASTKYEIKWKIFYRCAEPGSILTDRVTPFKEYRFKKRYWGADPLLFSFGNDLYCFFELFDKIKQKGKIAFFKFEDGRPTLYHIALDLKYHLSFPFVFLHKQSIYMIPETGSQSSIKLFKANSFPNNWVESKTILGNVSSSDTIVWKHNDDLYLLASLMDGSASRCHNICFQLDADLCPYHVLFKTTSSEEGNRNAGGIFNFEGEWYRVGQYSLNNEYGKGLTFFKINFDNKKTYSEEKILTIHSTDLIFENLKKTHGIHTYSSGSGVEIVDVKVKRRRLIVERVFLVAKRIIKRIFR